MRIAFGDLIWLYLTIILPSPRIISAFAPPSTSHSFQPAATTQRLMTTSSSSSSLGTTSTVPPLSGRIIKTLDPCVVLMKQMIGQYADAWKDKGGIYSLAQGVVYWKPPDSATAALVDAIHASQNNEHDPNLLHMYGPDEGLLGLRQTLQKKLVVENGLEHHDVMITVGANQAYVNCVLTLLEQHHKAVVFAP